MASAECEPIMGSGGRVHGIGGESFVAFECAKERQIFPFGVFCKLLKYMLLELKIFNSDMNIYFHV